MEGVCGLVQDVLSLDCCLLYTVKKDGVEVMDKPALRFLCDEMLKGLGRWLRAAGYDTLILEDGNADAALLQRAVAEGRLLLTRDRPLMEYRDAPGTVVLLHCNGLSDCAEEATRRLHIDWHFQAFSRCTVCNTSLLNATPEQRQQIPEDARGDEQLLYCPHCDKLYWEGSHVRRMRKRLQHWSEGDFTPD